MWGGLVLNRGVSRHGPDAKKTPVDESQSRFTGYFRPVMEIGDELSRLSSQAALASTTDNPWIRSSFRARWGRRPRSFPFANVAMRSNQLLLSRCGTALIHVSPSPAAKHGFALGLALLIRSDKRRQGQGNTARCGVPSKHLSLGRHPYLTGI